MDRDPELDVTLSNGRRVAVYQILRAHAPRRSWEVIEPSGLRYGVTSLNAALAARERMDRRIAERLAAGRVPVDQAVEQQTTPPKTIVPPDVAVVLGPVLDSLAKAREALRAGGSERPSWSGGVRAPAAGAAVSPRIG